MAVFTQLFSKLKLWKHAPNEDSSRVPSREENLSRALGKVEPYVVFLQRVLIWENPKQSVLFILALHGLFWFVVALELRFFFLLFGSALIVLLYKLWVEKVWPEIRVPLPAEQVDTEDWTPLHPRVLSAPEISHHLSTIMQFIQNNFVWLRNVRQDQPGLFCCFMSTICLILMWVGWTISGTTLLYCIFMSLLLAPVVFLRVLPPTALASLLEWQNNIHTFSPKDNDSDGEEYLLKPTVSDMLFLQEACEPETLIHDDDDDEFNLPSADFQHVADDITDSGAPSLMFLHGVQSMPAPEDLSLDSTDLSFALTKPETTQSLQTSSIVRHAPEDSCQDKIPPPDADIRLSDSDESLSHMDDERIHFRTRHFKKDSSSEEEAGPSKGSSQKNVSGEPRKGSLGGTMVGDAAAAVLSYSSAGALNLASLGAAVGQSLISSVISSSNPRPSGDNVSSYPKHIKEDDDLLSDTDDFEMISEEEFANL